MACHLARDCDPGFFARELIESINNAEGAVVDGRDIASGCHEAAPPPEPAVAVNARQLASAASHELHDS